MQGPRAHNLQFCSVTSSSSVISSRFFHAFPLTNTGFFWPIHTFALYLYRGCSLRLNKGVGNRKLVEETLCLHETKTAADALPPPPSPFPYPRPGVNVNTTCL